MEYRELLCVLFLSFPHSRAVAHDSRTNYSTAIGSPLVQPVSASLAKPKPARTTVVQPHSSSSSFTSTTSPQSPLPTARPTAPLAEPTTSPLAKRPWPIPSLAPRAIDDFIVALYPADVDESTYTRHIAPREAKVTETSQVLTRKACVKNRVDDRQRGKDRKSVV